MTLELFAYPKSASFGRIVAKEAIYRHSAVSTATKNLFVRHIDRIIWQFKLAPETINLPGTYAVPEIQIFSMQLKQEECSPDILAAIDRAVQFPVLFELCYQEQVRCVAAWKRPAGSSADDTAPGKWLITRHFFGPWLTANAPRVPLPQLLNLEQLYTSLIKPLLPVKACRNESMAEQVARIEAIEKLQVEIERCEGKLHKEKQFNKKVAINQELKTLQARCTLLLQKSGS